MIGRAVNGIGPGGMWDKEDGFYYDVLRLPGGSATRLKVRSMVDLLPICAVTAIDKWQRERVPGLVHQAHAGAPRIHPSTRGRALWRRRTGDLWSRQPDLLCRILTRMLDENEFLSIRSGEFRDPTSLAHQELIDILQPLARK